VRWVEIDPLARRLPTAVESTAYFVVAEVLTNIVKYADAHRATVRLNVSQGRFTQPRRRPSTVDLMMSIRKS
jgi:signal transduction histidine kinase